MMISYLVMAAPSRKPMPEDDRSNLAHLVGLRLALLGLQVEDLGSAVAGEDVVVALHALLEPERQEKPTEVPEGDGGVPRKDRHAIH